MTRHTNSGSTAPDPFSCIAALAVVTLGLGLLAAGAGVTTAQTAQPTVSVSSATTTVDDTATVDVVLTEAPDGLSGYYLDLTVDNPEAAAVTSASYPDEFGLTTDPTIDADGQTVTLEAADMEGSISPGATDVTLATVTVAGVAPGEVGLAVEPRQFDADDGSAFTPATQAGTLTVAGDDASSTDDAAPGGSDDAESADGSAADGGEAGATSNDLPLSPVLALVAIGLLVAAGVRRSD